MTLSDLLGKLEEASEGSRTLDSAIARYIGLTPLQEGHCKQWCRQDGRTDLTREMYIDAWAPSYTRSLDAALTLVPELSELHLDWWHIQAQATIYLAGEVAIDSETRPTPALAVVVAALKARQALSSTGDK